MTTMTNTGVGAATEVQTTDLVRVARMTGLLYLGLAITGIAREVMFRAQIFAADDPQGTLANLIEHASLARGGIALDLGVVVTQALVALWFYRLFRSVDSFAAGSLALFGMVNAVAFLGSAGLQATALDVAHDASLAAGGDTAATVQMLYVASDHLLGVAAVFFGLWLIPMGWLMIRSRWLPRPLGQLVVAGGVGYVVSAFVRYLFSNAELGAYLLTVPATIGELWAVGYLVIFGIRKHAPIPERTAPPMGLTA